MGGGGPGQRATGSRCRPHAHELGVCLSELGLCWRTPPPCPMPPAELPRYELGDRSYLREKVVTTYEALWRGEDIGPQGWTELFFLKVNAAWIQTNIATMPTDKLRPVARRLFAECRVRLGAQHDPAVQCHALETLSGFFLGLGCRRAWPLLRRGVLCIRPHRSPARPAGLSATLGRT